MSIAMVRVNRRVNFVESHRDKMVLKLGALGRPADYIAAATGLSVAQVRYRLNYRAGMRLTDIRHGKDKEHFLSVVENNPAVMGRIEDEVDKMLERKRVVVGGRMNPGKEK